MFKTIIFFDLDGTLQLNPFERAVWPVIVGEITQKTGKLGHEIIQMFEEESATRQNDDSIPAVLAMDFDSICTTVAQRLGVSLINNVSDLVRAHAATHSTLLEGALETLAKLRAPHRALVVATKGLARYQLPVMNALGLTPYFTSILSPDSHNGLKKHRHFFGEWADYPALRMMVGDLYDDDVLYPGDHGFKTVWKPLPTLVPADLHAYDPFTRAQNYPYTAHQNRPADAIILALRELPALVAYMEQQYNE
ncbi:MAG: hypothetical protein LCI00_22375 [Chloroflexi bacterium]|nr:hypothetical protein [Chloroflexota bacterium]MCC6895214.1 HAD family hydrolase [Anaerolineae bacterium]